MNTHEIFAEDKREPHSVGDGGRSKDRTVSEVSDPKIKTIRERVYEAIDPENSLGLRIPNSDELSQVAGLTEGTNELHLAMTESEGVVVIKQFTEDDEKGISPQERATCEAEVLQQLAEHAPPGVVVPRLLQEVSYDHNGVPTLVLEYIPDYQPLATIAPSIKKELTQPGAATIVQQAIIGLESLHKTGRVTHGDLLFGENIGLVPIQGGRGERCAFIDFELSEVTAQLSEEEAYPGRREDLAQLAAFLILQMGSQTSNRDRHLQKLSLLFQNYNPQLVGWSLDGETILP